MSDAIEKLEAKAAGRSLPPEERVRFYEKAANLRATEKAITEYSERQRAQEYDEYNERDYVCSDIYINWKAGLFSMGMMVILLVFMFVGIPLLAKAMTWATNL